MRQGYTFTGATEGYTDKSIFLPTAGYDRGGGRIEVGNYGYYWSSEAYDVNEARDIYFREGYATTSNHSRGNGMSVRAVR